ncbi:CPBP family intramembrane glutamic endopeptidase [Actinomyces gerencseriae]|uniref:CPBP family intramembrane glutamic endopeptidase n=1 Tax=Actinomyces gerencseriae TaxID=52769 RepID=UPI0006846D6A|nr:CPBP family intramembrane glutamic endopeptidase [Actinomyces gerencseriae]
MSAGDLLLVPLLLLGLLKNRPEDAAGAVMGTAATLASSLLVLFLTWLLVTRLDGGSLSDLRLRVDRRALAWMLAMVVVAVAIAAVIGVVMDMLGIEPAASGLTDLSPPVIGILLLARVNSAFLVQGFPEELVWRGWLFGSLGGTRRAGAISVIAFTLLHIISNGGQENWMERILYLAMPFGFAVAAVVVARVSGSTWAAVGVHGGFHMGSLVLLAMRTDEGHPVAWVLGGALWLAVAGVVRLLARRRILPCSTERAISV